MNEFYHITMLKRLFFVFSLIITTFSITSQNNIYYNISSEIQTGSGEYAPYFFSANKHGISSVEKNSGYLRAGIFKDLNREKVFSYAAGLDIAGSYNDYSKFRIQQLYLDFKLYCLNLSIGSKEYDGVFKNQQLSSGSMVWSGNARPIPQVRAGIFEFVTIPCTNGWLQLKGDISYGKFIDDKWLEDNYNYQYSFITTDVWYHQKKIFFRSKESKNFIVTLYAELASQFGGHQKFYNNGTITRESKDEVNIKDFIGVLIPGEGDATSDPGDQAYFYGNHLGTWNAIFEYKLKNESLLKGYFEWFFEDGSGMGKLNGWDGLWGIEYNTNKKGFISSVVFEYLQTTNQSGPIHWAPGDHDGTTLTNQATGADDYYNNYFYTGWANFGMANGNGMLTSPIYNNNGYLRFQNTRVIGLHGGIEGYIFDELSYKLLLQYNYGFGTPYIPSLKKLERFSGYLGFTYSPEKLNNYKFSAALGYDRGNISKQNTGFQISVIKTGLIK